VITQSSANISKTKNTIITNYLNNVDPCEYGTSSSTNQFFDQSIPYIPNILNIVNNKFSDYAQSPVISIILIYQIMNFI
jgi:hypothetical protein